MGKKSAKVAGNDDHIKHIEKLAHDYFDGNQKKNAGATIERNAKKALETELVNYGEPFIAKINDHAYLEMGFMDDESEEIDPKLFLKNHPDLFWELVSVPKTAVLAKLGDKEVAKNSRIVHTHTFKVKKHKSDPRG